MARSAKPRSAAENLDERPAPRKKSTRTPATLPSPAITVDYPQRGEVVVSREYTFRVSARAEGSVEASIDGGPWLACRHAEGFWWLDWSDYAAGRHEVRARVNAHKGFGSVTEPRDFVVELG